ncbi:MAG: hypothetical protein ABIZ80_16080 [Bryobacteraceae bacterium]
MMQRRDFVKLPGALLQSPRADTLRLWTFSDAHVGTDKKRAGRDSLTETIAQSEFGGQGRRSSL